MNIEGIDRIEYDALMLQRQQIVTNILETEKSFHQVFIAAVTVLSAAASILLTMNLSSKLYFVFTQALFLFLLFLMGLFSSMNNNRDYIRAIDAYVKERFDVHLLFYQGEISFKHINGFKSGFSFITLMGGVFAVVLFTVLIVRDFKVVVEFFSNTATLIIVSIEVIVIMFIILRNFVYYKITGKSKYYDDCIDSLQKCPHPHNSKDKTAS